ncbi:MAG TPA: FAD-binding oxidoreductase [Pyrinomonadaceae bacterium]|nr:FAD-binding oxidoreductase [Pyrinomonadaceae bacterium]
MLIKSEQEEIESYLVDASNVRGGQAARVVFPENAEEVAGVLAEASREKIPVTVSGAGTGIVGGRVPFGGIVLATDRLNRIKEIRREEKGGRAVAEAGVVLAEFQREVEARGLLYPPDPTERSCYLGGTVATNASGARTFKYGPTRNYVERLRVALATGDVIDIGRGEILADEEGKLVISLGGGRKIEARLPSYRMPRTRKHASGYYVTEGMDAVDLFIGSEGTLGVITEVEVKLLPKPVGVFSGVVFFDEEENLLAFVSEAREISLRARANRLTEEVDARALEYFDRNSLRFMREKFPLIPQIACGAIFFEQETTVENEDALLEKWNSLMEKHGALADDSWFALNEHDSAQMREFRHALPVLVNEWLARHGQRKVSTDMAVPDEEFAGMLSFYKDTLQASRLQFVIFGHIGDNHVHVNIMPRDEEEARRAREIYGKFIAHAVELGGTISAEHGIGKLKRDYLLELYGDEHIRQMAQLKLAFDPARILGRGNIFREEFLEGMRAEG